MRSLRITLLTSVLVLLPIAAFALEGIGPRVTITGIVDEIRITQAQAFKEEGGEIVVTATNGQQVTIVLTKDTEIISEGRLSRKQLLPINIVKGMQVRVRGLRLDSKSLNASLFIILNIEVNPALTSNGTLAAISGNSITVLSPDGQSRSFTLTNETEVNISYALRGANGLNLIGKQILLTLNPQDATQVRILRITGEAQAQRTQKPATVR